MPIEFPCTGCAKTLKVDDAFAGKLARCPACNAVLNVPGAPSPPEPAMPVAEPVADATPSADGSAAAPTPEAMSGGAAPWPPPPPDEPKYCAWENRDTHTGGFWGTLVETWKSSCLDPVKFFKRLPPDGPHLAPITFVLLCSYPAMILALGMNFLLNGIQIMAALDQVGTQLPKAALTAVGIGLVLTLPLFIVLGQYFWAAIIHLFLAMVGGDRKGFTATFRAYSYSQGPQILSFIPLVGAGAAVWSLILTIIGLREVHGISLGKAIAAVLLPIGVCCLLACGLGFFLVASVAGSIH